MTLLREVVKAIWRHTPLFLRNTYISIVYSRKRYRENIGNRISIAFVIQRVELFNSIKTVVEAARDAGCELCFIPIPRQIMGTDTFDVDNYDRVCGFCQDLGYGNVLKGYDKLNNKYLDLGKYKFDYVFINTPYNNQYPSAFSFDVLSQSGKLCYVSYGYSLVEKHLPAVYRSMPMARNISFIFASNRLEYSYGQRFLRLSELLGRKRLYNVGFPRFDLINGDKTNNRVILWIPRYTTNIGTQAANEQSSFLLFYKEFMKFASEHLDYRFIIRPHPLMFDNFLAKGVMGYEEIDEFKRCVLNSTNIELDDSPDYLEAFNEASILLADYSSTVAEYYVSGKPIVYFGSQKDFSRFDSEMFDTFYNIGTWDEAKTQLLNLMNGTDSRKDGRLVKVGEFCNSHSHHAGKAIVDVIIEDYGKNRK